MFKSKYSPTVNLLFFLCIFLSLLYPNNILANNKTPLTSTVTLPLDIDLKVFENYLNEVIPDKLADINKRNIDCIKSKCIKTKFIPKCSMKGFKISCKKNSIKIRTIPKLKCDVVGWVKRDGHISVSGKGETLRFTLPIRSEISIKAKLSETAHARAVLYIDVIPRIDKDWSVSMNLTPDIKWTKKPMLRLLKFMKITFQSKVEPRLKTEIDKFIKKIPQLLADFKVKEKIDKIWEDIQEPIKLDNDSDIYLLFKPEDISYSGLNIVDNILKTTISAKGKTEIILGTPTVENCIKSELCHLGSISNQKGKFNFDLPVSITYKELSRRSEKKILKKNSLHLIESSLPGILKISDPKIEKGSAGQLSISAHINYDNRSSWLKKIDIFNWFDIDGKITFKGTPRIDKINRSLILDNMVYDSITNNDLFDLLVDASELELLSSYFATRFNFEFGQKVDDAVIKTNNAISSFSKNNLTVSAYLHIASIDGLILDYNKITVYTKLSGVVNANIGL